MAVATSNVNFKMDTELKETMDAVCKVMGLNLTTAFTIFAKKVVAEQRIPFEVAVPRASGCCAGDTVADDDDPFYSPANISYLEGIMRDVREGKARFEEHDLIEVD